MEAPTQIASRRPIEFDGKSARSRFPLAQAVLIALIVGGWPALFIFQSALALSIFAAIGALTVLYVIFMMYRGDGLRDRDNGKDIT